jgi:hypothetical protein
MDPLRTLQLEGTNVMFRFRRRQDMRGLILLFAFDPSTDVMQPAGAGLGPQAAVKEC